MIVISQGTLPIATGPGGVENLSMAFFQRIIGYVVNEVSHNPYSDILIAFRNRHPVSFHESIKLL